MFRSIPILALAVLALAGCSSTSVYNLQKSGAPVATAPRLIFVSPFAVRAEVLHLGERSRAEKAQLGAAISAGLASITASELQRYAAPSAVLTAGRSPGAGTWHIRGEILKVDQGSRALRTAIGFGIGRTQLRTRVTVTEIRADGPRTILTFRTTGSSGLEPGVAFGVVGGASAAKTAGGALLGSMAGVSSDMDRTAHEIAAVLSAYLSRNGLLSPSRQALTPNIAGQLPTTINACRIVPAPVRHGLSP
ncbi:MAG: DUF4410 domain-containing protein [Planctomycetia bacterium]